MPELRMLFFRFISWLRGKKPEMASDIIEQQISHITAEALFHHDPQGRQIFTILRKGVGRNQPATVPQALGEVKNRKIRDLLEGESKNGNIASVTEKLKPSHLLKLTGQVPCNILTGFVNTCISCSAQAQEIVILRHNLIAWTREIDGKGGHFAA